MKVKERAETGLGGVGGTLLPHPHTVGRPDQGGAQAAAFIGGHGWGPYVTKGHTLDLEVTTCSQVVDGLQVEAVGELEFVSIRQLDG